MDKKLCDICMNEMDEELRNIAFECELGCFHTDAPIYTCKNCGYEKVKTCSVQLWEDDEKQSAQQDSEESTDSQADEPINTSPEKETATAPKVLTKVDGKTVCSDEWLDWMLDKYDWFLPLYNRLISKQRKEQRYLMKHAPSFKAILNDVLYDTETSTMFYMEEKNFEHDKCRMYYYVTKSGKFFRIITKFGDPDELTTMDVKSVKKILSHKPAIYKAVVPGEIFD